MWAVGIWGALWLGLVWLAVPAGAQAPGTFSTAEETRREFEAVCQTLRASGNPYFGEAILEELPRRLAETLAPAEEARTRRELAHARLRVGDNDAAVRELSRALQLAATTPLPKEAQLVLLQDLALAYLRLGEVTNCVGHHRPGMCLLPISESGRHLDPEGSQAAMRAYLGVLAGTPRNHLAKWLLNIAAMTLGRYPEGVPVEHRVPEAAVRSAHDVGRFHDVAHHAGLAIRDTAGGAVIDDFDGDGLLDVITTAVEPCTPMRFFRLTRAGTFEDFAAEAGLAGQLGGSNLIHGDVDNDGDRDLYVLRGGWFGRTGRIRNSLLLNDGRGRFVDATHHAGLAEPALPAQSAAFADYDGDGDLDLYVANEGLDPERAFASQLFRNELRNEFRGNEFRDHGLDATGVVTFTDVARVAGVTNDRYAKGVTWGDYDNDGRPDLYLSNLGPNRLYRNLGPDAEGAIRFTDVAPELGLTAPEDRSFPTWWFDFDNDGWLDLFVAAYSASTAEIAAHFLEGRPSDAHPRLYRNLGAAGGAVTFSEVSAAMGLSAPSLPMGANFGDLDNDGYLDFYLGTGIPDYRGLMPNLMYRNDGGRRFQDVTYSGGFGHLQKGHGVAFADFDNDGDQDVFEQMGGVYRGDTYPSALYQNPGHGHHWLQLELVGTRSNRDGIGARVTVTVRDGMVLGSTVLDGSAPGTPGERRIHRRVGTGGSFGGS
ncbi:MAG: FG-GAP-like repeat-containing protein, partial [Acidobacteriota bacterium]